MDNTINQKCFYQLLLQTLGLFQEGNWVSGHNPYVQQTLHITLYLTPDVKSHQAENNHSHTPIKDYCFKYCTALQIALTEAPWVELRLNIYPVC